ncbi:hypothetical protein NMD1_00984 [Novosphingobium sp. MD-1]|nr:hypothetical protein NMD1_00984 [Novosphingobium sp. MD-1]
MDRHEQTAGGRGACGHQRRFGAWCDLASEKGLRSASPCPIDVADRVFQQAKHPSGSWHRECAIIVTPVPAPGSKDRRLARKPAVCPGIAAHFGPYPLKLEFKADTASSRSLLPAMCQGNYRSLILRRADRIRHARCQARAWA